jgi:hypothetical protein
MWFVHSWEAFGRSDQSSTAEMFVECLQARRIGVHYSEPRTTPIITHLFSILHNTLKLAPLLHKRNQHIRHHLDCFLLVVRRFQDRLVTIV